MTLVILRRLATALLIVIVAALLFILLGPALYGPALLSRLGGPFQLTATSLSGPLWDITARGVTVTGPGVAAKLEQAGVGVASLNPFTRTARLDVSLSGGTANLKLKALLDQFAGSSSAASPGVIVLPGKIDLNDVKLSVDGQGLNVPNGRFSVSGGSTSNRGGQLTIKGQTEYGDTNAVLTYAEQGGAFSVVADLDADARLINAYWQPGGVRAGRVSGQYHFRGGVLEGDLKLSGGAVEVPQAKFVTLSQLSGRFTQSGNVIQGQLSGQGLGGPLTADANVDLKAQRWQVTAQGTPNLAFLDAGLGLPASGTAQFKASASGWTDVQAQAELTAASGEVISIPFEALNATYAFAYKDGQVTENRLKAQTAPRLLGEKQTLSADWAFGERGTLALGGRLAQEPLNIAGQISVENVITLSGSGLGGPVQASYDLGSRQLRAELRPQVYGMRGQLSASGKPDDLALMARNVQVGPLTLDGQGKLSGAGLRASLTSLSGGTLNLFTDRSFAGRWALDQLSLAGATLTGSGAIDLPKGLGGQLSAEVPGVTSDLSGPLSLNWSKQTGSWQAGAQRLSWNGPRFGLIANALEVAGLSLGGQLAFQSDTQNISGTLQASGNGAALTVTGEGQRARVVGTLGGVGLEAVSELRSPFTTRASIKGADISGVLSYENGLNFTLNTGAQTARGTIDGQNWDVRGQVDLAALRPLLGNQVPDLDGTLTLGLAGLGGTASVQASAAGANVRGTLTRRNGQVTADVNATQGDLAATLRGQVYPQVQLSGPVTWRGAGGPQTVQAALSGEYGNLSVRADGQTAAFSSGGVSLPAQALRVRGSLTPNLALNGSWGDLNLTYRSGEVAVQGRQALSAAGESGTVNVDATWKVGDLGALAAAGQLGPYRFRASGPWTALQVNVSGAGLQASGQANIRTLEYSADVSGLLAGLNVEGQVRGRGAEITGNLNATDSQGGRATVRLNSLEDFALDAQNLTVAGQTLQGQLSAVNGRLSGQADLGPLSVQAQNGAFTASGSLYNHTINASGQLRLPATLTQLDLNIDGPQLSAQASGSGEALRGTLTLKAQQYSAAGVKASLAAQTFPLEASLSPLAVKVGGLEYAGGAWNGAATLNYALEGQTGARQTGSVQLIGDGQRLSAAPRGSVTGRIQVLPQLGGTLQADLSALEAVLPPALLPAQVRDNLIPGVLSAQITPQSAELSLSGGRWLGEVLGLTGQVSWANGLKADAVLTHPDSKLPLSYDGQELTLRGAVLDAQALRPWLAGTGSGEISGTLRADLTLPQLQISQASGQADVQVRVGEQSARGQLKLRSGQVGGTLQSDLYGYAARLDGEFYPQAEATFSFGELNGTLRGDANAQDKAGAWTAQIGGSFASRAVDARATLSAGKARLVGAVAGLNLDLSAAQQDSGWQLGGRFDSADLLPLTGQPGQLAGTLSGTPSDLTARASGNLSGVSFILPLRYQNGVLNVQSASLTRALDVAKPNGPAARASLSGQVYPALNLTGRATLDAYAPGNYQLSASGPYRKLRLTLNGQLSGDVLGLGLAGTQLEAILSGQDFVLTARGEALAGQARGRTDVPNYLQTARFTLHTPYKSGETALRLDGPIGWNAKSGWLGSLRAQGQVPGGQLDARLSGNGELQLVSSLGPARVSGSFPASLPTRPGGTLKLELLDVGAFWSRPGQLNVSGQTQLGGPTWSDLSADFSGQLSDAGGAVNGDNLSGTLSGRYAAGQASLALRGQSLQAQAELKAGQLSASLHSQGVTLARVLPPNLGVDSLRFVGILEAQGSLASGLTRLDARSLYLSGSQSQVGNFRLIGSAQYGRAATSVARADLNGQLYGGTFSAQGDFASGLTLAAQNLKLPDYGLSAVGGSVVLKGDLTNPSLSGNLQASRPEGTASAVLSGRLRDPRLNLRADLRGDYSGTVYASAEALNLARQTAQLHLYGNAARAGSRVQLDLRGVWPQLRGAATAQLAGLTEPVELSGNGDGSYQIGAGTLGSGQFTLKGVNPVLDARATITPLPLLGAEGQGQVQVSVQGPLTQLRASASGFFRNVTRSGISLPDTALSLSGPVTALTGELTQDGASVATFQNQTFTFNSLRAQAAGSVLQLSGSADLSGKLDAQLSASGTVGGSAKLTYGPAGLTAAGTLTAAQFSSRFDISASSGAGWRGEVNVIGGPSLSGVGPLLSSPARLTLAGRFAAPQLSGSLGLVGANAQVIASTQGLQLRWQDGPSAQASGILALSKAQGGGYVWSGQSQLTLPEGELQLALSGEAANPSAELVFKRGGWTAQGQGNLQGARLNISDGDHRGQLSYDGQVFKVSGENLDLAKLGIDGLGGSVSAVGSLDSQLSGAVQLSFSNLTSGATLPYLDLPLTGSGRAAVQLTRGVARVQANVTAPYGQVALSARQTGEKSAWTGRLTGQLTKDGGRAQADVTLSETGAGGQLTVQNLPLKLNDLSTTISGSVKLDGQTFTLSAQADGTMGRAELTGDGGLADLLPSLTPLTSLRPTGTGYRVQVGLGRLDLSQLGLGAGLGGTVSGQLTLSDGLGTFALRSEALELGDASFPARIDGNLADGDWRLRGFIGNSTLFGAVTAGQLSVRGQLLALPIGNIIAGFTGKLPGNGVLTGVARLDAPIDDLLSGHLSLVAERVRVTAGPDTANADTLIGSGKLDFDNRELRELSLRLSGAGEWDISGQYTRQKVDLRAAFSNTTFTPILAFVPSLSDLAPALQGSLTLSVGGSYDQPTASLSGSKLAGTIAGIGVQLPSLRGNLGSDGLFTAQSSVQAAGGVSGSGNFSLAGQLSGSQLSNTLARYQGSLSADVLGDLGTIDAQLRQGSAAWTVQAQARQGGTLSLSGQVSPDFNLKLAARSYNLPIRAIYARESSLNGDLTAITSGEQIVVGGSLNFTRLVLGRLGAAPLPVTPGTPDGSANATATNGDTASFVSPLPEELTVFPSVNGEKPVSPLLRRIVLQDIPIRAPGNIRVDESLAQAELSANLTLSGSGADPRLSGAVSGVRGNLLLRDNNFALQTVNVTFDGSSLYPVFGVTARGRVPDQAGQIIGVQLQADGSFVVQNGTRALQLTTNLTCTSCQSQDEYSQAELYSLLALGTPDISTLGNNIGALGQNALSTALNVFVLGELQRNIARALGVDVFRISSNLVTPEGNFDAKFTVGTYLSKQFYLQYQVDLTGANLIDATYTTPDNRFTLQASSAFGLNLQSARSAFSVGYNLSTRSRLTLGVESGNSTRFSAGYVYKY